MAQTTVNDPYQAENQGLPAGSKPDAEPTNAATCSPWNRKPSPERQKEKSLGVHRDHYADSKAR